MEILSMKSENHDDNFRKALHLNRNRSNSYAKQLKAGCSYISLLQSNIMGSVMNVVSIITIRDVYLIRNYKIRMTRGHVGFSEHKKV